MVVTITDASWANDSRIVESGVYKRRSQYGRITLLAPPTIWDPEVKDVKVHFIGWKSGLIRRVCRSTFRAETIGATYGVEFGDFIRATMSELEGNFTFKDWDK